MAKVEQFPDPSGEKTIEQDIKAQKTKEITKEVRNQIKEAVPEQATDTRVGPGGDRLAGEDAGTGRDRSAEGIPDSDRARMEENDEGGAREPRKRTLPDDTLLMGSSADKRADAGKGARGDARRGARRDSQEDEDGENVLIGFPGLFRKKKEKEGASNLSYQEKIRRYRAKNRTYRFFAAVIAVMAVLLVVLFMMNRHYNRAEIVKIRDFVAEEGAVCANFDGCVLQYGPNGAVCADTNGHVKWSITYEMDEPIISIRGKIAAIADYGGRTIYVMNKKKQLYTVSTSLPIHKVEASECGEVAAVLDDKTSTWIRLYSKTGKEVAYFVRSMEENGYPMDLAISPSGSMVCVSSLMMKDMSVVSNLTFYDFGKAGKNYEQHVAASFEYENEVLPYVWFMGNNRCAAVSDSRFVVFDTSGTEPKNSINNMLTENLQGLFEDGDHVGLLFNDLTQENMYRLDLYDQNGQKEGDVGFTMAYNDLQMTGGRVYINNEQTMQIYTTDGKEIFNGGFDRAIKVLIPSRWLGGLTAVSENEIDAIKLR
jgi:hypothetical protein